MCTEGDLRTRSLRQFAIALGIYLSAILTIDEQYLLTTLVSKMDESRRIFSSLLFLLYAPKPNPRGCHEKQPATLKACDRGQPHSEFTQTGMAPTSTSQ